MNEWADGRWIGRQGVKEWVSGFVDELMAGEF